MDCGFSKGLGDNGRLLEFDAKAKVYQWMQCTWLSCQPPEGWRKDLAK
jgi:hypothetical protein